MYLLSGFGVTVGFHRMLTHRSFKTHKATQYVFAYLGMLSVQGPVIDWVADHRKHHAHTDPRAIRTPRTSVKDGGAMGALKGLWHAHTAWLWRTHGQARAHKYAKDLVEDRGMRILNRKFPLIALASLLIPAVLGGLLSWSWMGALIGLIRGGFVRIFLQHHVTWSVNSVCHFFGKRRFDVEDHSTNVFWLAIPSFGESWHHNHHAFPRSAAHGLKWYEIDPSQLVIGAHEARRPRLGRRRDHARASGAEADRRREAHCQEAAQEEREAAEPVAEPAGLRRAFGSSAR